MLLYLQKYLRPLNYQLLEHVHLGVDEYVPDAEGLRPRFLAELLGCVCLVAHQPSLGHALEVLLIVLVQEEGPLGLNFRADLGYAEPSCGVYLDYVYRGERADAEFAGLAHELHEKLVVVVREVIEILVCGREEGVWHEILDEELQAQLSHVFYLLELLEEKELLAESHKEATALVFWVVQTPVVLNLRMVIAPLFELGRIIKYWHIQIQFRKQTTLTSANPTFDCRSSSILMDKIHLIR